MFLPPPSVDLACIPAMSSTNQLRTHQGRIGRSSQAVVGDPGIEPGMGLPGGVTVRCRTLQRVALVA